ncbi:MAG: hypothetical protein J6V97_08570 [Prevotella sp.]|nr:hypothetical protein [Prevotella sp.]
MKKKIFMFLAALVVSTGAWAQFFAANGNNSATPSPRHAPRHAPTVEDNWMYYDDGVYSNGVGIGSGSTIYWGIMLPAATLTGNIVEKISVYEDSRYNIDPITVMIYSGGDTAPAGNPLYTETFTPVGGSAFHEITLASPVTIDQTQNVWVILQEYGTYIAQGCVDTGEPNGRFISMDGVTYADVTGYGLYYTWMLRAYITNAVVDYDVVTGTSEHGTLSFKVDGEEVEGEPVQANPGQEVTVVVTPETGWISSSVIARPYSSWEVAAARGAAQDIEIIQPINATKTALRNQWTFTMPANNVEVSVNYIDIDDVIELLRQETELAMMLFRSFGDTKDVELLKEMFKAIGQANSLLKKYDSGQDVSLDDAQNLLELLQSFNDQFADVVTGITGVNQNENQNQYYDLQGRRVAQPTKGLYILNGKKVVVK